MQIDHRDYRKHPLTDVEFKQLCLDRQKAAKRDHRKLVAVLKSQKRNPPKGGPRY